MLQHVPPQRVPVHRPATVPGAEGQPGPPGLAVYTVPGVQLRIFTEPQQGASYDDLLAVAQAAERLGFDAFFRSDHYLVMGGGDGLPGPDRRLGHAGRARPRHVPIRLGTLVTSATFR